MPNESYTNRLDQPQGARGASAAASSPSDAANEYDHDLKGNEFLPEQDEPPDYEFGPIENKQRRIVALLLRLNVPLPIRVDELIRKTLGQPTIDDPEVRLWKLTESISYIDDEWRWLANAFEWASDDLGQPIVLTEKLCGTSLAETVASLTGPTLNIYRRGSEAESLIKRYKAARSAQEAEPSKPAQQDRGFQRLLNRTWNTVKQYTDLNPVDRLTLFAVLRYCWSRDHCQEWEKTLADDVGCSIRTLQRSLAKLVKHKFLSVTNRHRQKSIYRVLRKDLIPPYPKKQDRGLSDKLTA